MTGIMALYRRTNVVLGHHTTSYLAAGEIGAPVVVLLHDGAWGGSAEVSWRRLIPLLAQRYRVIAPDLYGYGASSKVVQLDAPPFELRLRQVAALLDHLGLEGEPVDLVGNSFGGAAALRAATEPWFAWRLRSVVSITGTGGPFRTDKSLVELARFDGTRRDMQRIASLLTGRFGDFEQFVDDRYRNALDPGHYRAIAAVGLKPPVPAGGRSADRYPDSLAQAGVPIALVKGLRDGLLEPDWAERIAAHAPSATVHALDAHHCPNVSLPHETADLLSQILDRVHRD